MKLPFCVKNNLLILGTAVSVLLFVLLSVVGAQPTKAAVPPLGAPFGGVITSVFYCPCSANLAIVVGPPSPGTYTYQPGVSMVYPFYQIFRPGPWVKGSYIPGTGVCATGYFCATVPTMGTISDVGTSL